MGAAVAALAAVWCLLQWRSTRPDGDLLRVHAYRRLLWFITPSRSQAAVPFDTYVDATRLVTYTRAVIGASGNGFRQPRRGR